ncbi:PAS domain S-box protein [Fulvivirgaceae bacterium PWU5]|uniref:histidine kinase n=1 Tax=Dawidia cretensis TaxID=2782350 RepID=A0AAP2GW15_9BACT|nr:ATP-binding protein [Dawidia cretensis]MBT1711703.1 PAS domain S-box protein [Dawidia cretensis]
MKEIVRVSLENEMDLILAHKRSMKLAELCGLSLSVQTTFATAVSEIARCAIESGAEAFMMLGIDFLKANRKQVTAIIYDTAPYTDRWQEAVSYAKRLADNVKVVRNGPRIEVSIHLEINFAGIISASKLESFTQYFAEEPPISPYDEIRRKNIQLQDLAQRLRESEASYRFLSDRLPLMIFSVNHLGTITFSNKWLQDFLGIPLTQLDIASWQQVLHTDDQHRMASDLNQLLIQKKPLRAQYRLRQKSTDKYLWHMISILPAENDRDMTTQWIGFIVDIHAQKQVEQTLKDNTELKDTQQKLVYHQQQLELKIEALNRSNYELEQFAHLASHDLQEPLRKLFFYADVLQQKYRDTIDASGVQVLNNMTQAAGRMKELIHDLLAYSELNQHEFEFGDVNLDTILEDLLKDFEIAIRDKGAIVRKQPLPMIRGNALKLRQLFSNLLSNALKYARTGVTPQIDITCLQTPDALAITVRDNGIGFDPKQQDRIFELFERLHSRARYPGTGIGLSICKRIAELHHGSISASAEAGQYASFLVTLPLSQQSYIHTA